MYPIPQVKKFSAKVCLNDISQPVIKGAKYNFHFGLITYLGTIRKLVSEYKNKHFKKVIKKKPRLLISNSYAEITIKLDKRGSIENSINFKSYSTFQISNKFETLGFGQVTTLHK